MADYLEAYAAHFRLPVRCGLRVERLSRLGDRFLVVAGDRRFEADNVVVAMADYQRPRVPAFTLPLAPGVGLAEGPGESFGEHRCGLLADGILDARDQGARGHVARSECAIARFARAGVEIDVPYLEPAMDGRHVF